MIVPGMGDVSLMPGLNAPMRIPIYSGDALTGFVRDEATLDRYRRAVNVELKYGGKGVASVHVKPVLTVDDGGRGVGANSMLPTYSEELVTGPLCMLKRVNEWGEFECWSARDGFNPRRFNPDTVASSNVRALR